jgi:predicted nuclease of predicted toxin-antitoxin system
MKILIDMNLSPRWADIFFAHNIEAIHWSRIGLASAPDSEIMAYAKANNYIVFTHDLDFSAILAITQNDKPSVIQIRTGDISPDVTGQLVINALSTAAEELEKGALITIDLKKIRLQILPLAGNE